MSKKTLSTNIEILNNIKIQNINDLNCFGFKKLVISICLGFRILDFGFNIAARRIC